MTEEELASAIEVSPQTLTNIIANEFPEDSAVWDKFTRYFRMDVDVLQTGGSTHSIMILNLSDRTLQFLCWSHSEDSAAGLASNESDHHKQKPS